MNNNTNEVPYLNEITKEFDKKENDLLFDDGEDFLDDEDWLNGDEDDFSNDNDF